MIDWNTSNKFDQNIHYYFLDEFSTPGFMISDMNQLQLFSERFQPL